MKSVSYVSTVDLNLLKGISQQKAILLDNTRRFALGLPANNALLWGARGSGKSALIKAVHAAVSREIDSNLALVEIYRDDVATLPSLLEILGMSRCILFCDDLSFEVEDTIYKSLKGILEGGIRRQPATVLFYATSNHRHMIVHTESKQILPGTLEEDTLTEQISLSDRFGLWLGFYSIDKTAYLDITRGYAKAFFIPIEDDYLLSKADMWSLIRGARSGRVSWQFIQDLFGHLGTNNLLV